MVKTIGIDCSTQSFAFSIFEDDRLTHWGELSFGKGDLLHRINNANRVINASLDQEQFKDIDRVVFESATYIQNKQTVIFLAYAFGAAIAPFVKPGVEAVDVNPMTWQNFIGNKAFTKSEKDAVRQETPNKSDSWYKERLREIRKERNMKFVKDTFGVEVESDNIADAICVGWWGVNNGE